MTASSTDRTAVASQAPSGFRVRVQRFGAFLSGMVMPNIPAFIAWGLITALFIQTGWIPVAVLGGFGEDANGVPNAGLVGPMIKYLLPLLIAFTGGRMVYGHRGGVVGAVATMGVIVGSASPMFLGALIVGPLAAWVMKKIDSIWDGKIRPGFEMLVNNFSAGIAGMLMALVAFFGLAPLLQGLSDALGAAVDFLTEAGLLPLASIIIEPAKVLFLNNAINQGVLTPLGTDQAAETGKSILFLLEANPGPGLGLLLGFMFFGVGISKATAPGAIIIQFFGGIHEIYFPYVLSKPILLLSVIAGGMTGVLTNVIFNSGLVSVASPGSIIAIMAVTARDSYVGVILSVLLSATVSFLITAVILRASRRRDLEAEAAGEDGLGAATARMEELKGKKSSVADTLRRQSGDPTVDEGASEQGATTTVGAAAPAAGDLVIDKRFDNIVFACDAGMGSSAMGASVLRNKIKKAGVTGVTVVNKSIANLDGTEDLIITHRDLTDRAKGVNSSARHVSVDNFMSSPKYDEIVRVVQQQHAE